MTSTVKFRVDLLAAAPAIEVLACSLCFILKDVNDHTGGEFMFFGRALRNLRLREILISGYRHDEACQPRECNCCEESGCSLLLCRAALRSADLVHLSELSALEDLTICGVNLVTSAYANLGNPGLLSLKLCLNVGLSDEGVRCVIEKSKNLKYMKLEAPELDLTSVNLWETLAEANLRQLCLRTSIENRDIQRLDRKCSSSLWKLLEGLEFIHLHCHRCLVDCLSSGTSGGKVQDYKAMPLDSNLRLSPGFVGRGICYAESSAGLVPPTGWEIN